MNILITGNMGYVGPVLTRHLKSSIEDLSITGFDNGYFAHCLTDPQYLPELRVNTQYFGDIRQLPTDILKNIDAVVHLAGISNDPVGDQFESVTHDINSEHSASFARMAKCMGVKKFVFASSCSLYGFASENPRKEDDTLNPLTAYAKSKLYMEDVLQELSDDDFNTTCLRFATACGMSDRLRLDLVFNDFVVGAVITGKIEVLSDGSPWRPLVHVADMARAFEWALAANENNETHTVVNVGSDDWTFQMGELAHKVSQIIPNTNVSINKEAQPDKRSYKVNFSRYKELAPNHQPAISFEQAVSEIINGIKSVKIEANFRQSIYTRLAVLQEHIHRGNMDSDLFWKSDLNHLTQC